MKINCYEVEKKIGIELGAGAKLTRTSAVKRLRNGKPVHVIGQLDTYRWWDLEIDKSLDGLYRVCDGRGVELVMPFVYPEMAIAWARDEITNRALEIINRAAQ